MRSPGRRNWILCIVAAALLAPAPTAATPRDEGAPATDERGGARAAAGSGAAPQGGPPAFVVTGVRDSASAATVVHCTNRGSVPRTVFVDIFEFDGSFDCNMSFTIAPNETRTYATREVAVYVEDDECVPAPETAQGLLFISPDGPTTLVCTVQVVDPASATPAFQTNLDLFRP